MLSIRLTRTGKKNAPHYRIVVQEKRSKLNGSAIDIIGHYHPADKDKLVVIDKEKAEKWMKAGAQPSDTVTNLMVKNGIFAADRKVTPAFVIPEKKAEPVVEAAAEEAAEPAEVDADDAAETADIAAEEPVVAETAAEIPAEEAPAATE